MRIVRALYRLVLAASLFASGPALALPCAGFTDVDSADPFCPDVTWVRNRGITLGCTATLYCPSAPVSRLAMAAFLQRLGAALAPMVYGREDAPGAIALDASPNLCLTDPVPPVAYDRTALVDVGMSAVFGASAGFSIRPIVVYDGLPATPLTSFGAASSGGAGQWLTAAHLAQQTVPAGVSPRYGIQATRATGMANPTQSQCHIRLMVVDGRTS